LPAGFGGARPVSTAIYFLLAGNDFSALHRLRSDEMWHFYAGASLEVHVINPEGAHSVLLVGSDPFANEVPQAAVRAGCWFGSRLRRAGSYALVGCTVAPGFDFADFELAKRAELSVLYQEHLELIRQLTRG
jgi:predicted cupin superfamily sugar epimerase